MDSLAADRKPYPLQRAASPRPALTRENASEFAALLQELAVEARAEEAKLWETVAEMAAAGDAAAVRRIAEMRRTTAPGDILTALKEGRLK
jgi:hypothetical protein